MRTMDAYIRSLVISLALSLTIVDLTQGFTLRNQFPQDLEAEESSHLTVKNDLNSSNDIQTPKKEEAIAILPVQAKQEATINSTANTEAVQTTEHTLVDKTVTEEIRLFTSTEQPLVTFVNTNLTTIASASDILSTESLETTTASVTTKTDDTKSSNDTIEDVTLNVPRKNIEFDNAILPAELNEMVNSSATTKESTTNAEKTTTEFSEQTTEAQLSTTNKEKDETTIIHSESTTTESQSTETSAPVTSLNLSPTWKKYSSISRNRVENTEKEEHTTPVVKFRDSINSHTTESRVTLEKVFVLSPDIESLQNLKVNLMETASATIQPSLETTNDESQTEFISKTRISTQDVIPNGTKVVVANQTEMVSKMAGFLDHTKMNSSEIPVTTVKNSGRHDMEYGVSYEADLQEDVEHKKSHSQLAEDALKESLLEESLMHDREVNSKRYRQSTTEKGHSLDVVTLKTTTDVQPVAATTAEKAVDELSVKPISPEKKNTNIYAVNPNYKPLKKIDVQPPKPFTRDPDDNSWRNESLTSLGIVFKAKNASKAFTEVLKNKTETVMNSLPEVNRTVEKYELRDRLEKIAEQRKSKKKKVDKFGNTEYTDYEENNNSGDSLTSKELPPSSSPLPVTVEVTSTTPTTIPVSVPLLTSITKNRLQAPSTEKPKKTNPDYYDNSDDDDYPTLPNVDIMKATIRPRVQWPVTQKIIEETTKQYLPERKPTVQYFPPLPKQPADVSINEYDDAFKQKLNLYKPAPPTETTKSPSVRHRNYPTETNYRTSLYDSNENRIPQAIQHVQYTPVDGGAIYFAVPPKSSSASYESPETFSRGFTIRQYKDLINSAIKDNDYDRNAYLFTEIPVTGVTATDGKMAVKSEEYDYEQRKEVLDKFVDNFNQNHEQFKVDFPVLFNSSVVHRQGQEGGKVSASSSATFKRLYNDDTATKVNGFIFSSKPYDPSCENITVELAPAYELHYYVPGQEEREESKATVPYGYRL